MGLTAGVDNRPYVVVICQPDGTVCSVLGPCEDKTTARALAEVVRLEDDATAHVRPLRDADVSDLHARGVFRDAPLSVNPRMTVS